MKTIKGTSKAVKTYTLNPKNEIIEKSIHKKLPDQKFRIVLTDLGKSVLEYLMNHFNMIINIEFTSLVEKDLDRVANGEIEWQTVVGKVYDSFKDTLNVQKSLKSKKNKGSSKNSNQERVLGEYKDIPVILKNGKYGPYVSYKDKNYTLQYILKDKKIEYDDIRLELVLDTIKYPLCLGKHKGSPVEICLGPYGKYMKYKKKNFRIPQKEEYSLEECIGKIY